MTMERSIVVSCLLLVLPFNLAFFTKPGPPLITKAPHNQYVLAKAKAVFICNAKGNPTPSIYWEKDNKRVNPRRYRFLITDQPPTSVLSIDPVRFGRDDGVYTCVAENGIETVRETANLTVYKNVNGLEGAYPKITAGPERTTVDTGQEAILTCRVSGTPEPQFLWFKNNLPVDMEDSRITMSRSGSLYIRNTTEYDLGWYECLAQNVAGLVVSSAAMLSINVRDSHPTTVSITPQRQTVARDEKVSFICKTNSSHPSSFRWETGSGSRVSPRWNRYLITNSPYMSVLSIDPVKPNKDATQFVCVSARMNRVQRTTANLSIYDADSDIPNGYPEIVVSPSDVIMTEIDTAILQCEATGTPKPTIQWLKNQIPLNMSDPRITVSKSGHLNIRNSTGSDTGRYECVAQNDIGVAHSESVMLYVKVYQNRPVLTREPQDKHVNLGETVMFTCEAIGIPSPSFTWVRNSKMVDPSLYHVEGNTSTLMIENVQVSDNNTHVTCTAANKWGEAWGDAWIRIVDDNDLSQREDLMPRIIRAPQNHKVAEDMRVSFVCIATGDPAPTLHWETNNKKIMNGTFYNFVIFMKQNQSVMKIDPVRVQRDNATFTCVAKNVHGEARANATLRVYGKNDIPQGYPSARVFETTSVVQKGYDANMFCLGMGTPSPQITWFQDNFPVDMSSQHYRSTLSPGRFTIYDIRESDSRNYECVVENDVGIAYNVTHLHINVHPDRPIIIEPPQDQFARVGQTVKFSCTTTARCLSAFHWSRQNIAVEPRRYTHEKHKSVYTVYSVGLKDNNTYIECTASNDYGKTWGGAWIRIVEEAVPQGPPENFKAVKINETRVRLRWEPPAQANGDIVMYEISYHKMSDPSNVRSLNVTDTRVTIPGLEIKTNYCSSIRAFNNKGAGPWRSKLHFQTSRKAKPQTESHAPQITKAPQSHKVAEGYKVSFTCEASGDPVPTLHWAINNKNLRKCGRSRYLITDKQNRSVLTIQPARFQKDNATFTCVAKNVQGETRANATLQVYEDSNGEKELPVGYPRIITHPKLKTVQTGHTAFLSCEAEGTPKPNITWFKDYLPLNMSDSRLKLLSSGFLNINHARESDTGRYECVAENKVGVVYSYSANLYVKVRRVPPHFTVRPKNINVRPGSDVNLTCVAVGSPVPFVKWRQGIYELTDEDKVPLGRNVLQLKHVTESKQYTCIASSELGSIESAADVIVEGPVSKPWHVQTRALNSTSIVVSWEEPTVSFGDIQGYKVFCTLQPEKHIFSWRVQDVAKESKVTTISGLEPNHSYTISILAYSGSERALSQLIHVKTKPSVSSQTNVRPQITRAPKNHNVAEGLKVSFICEASGVPAPSFHWEKENSEINPRDRYNVTDRTNLSVLTIEPIKQSDRSMYTCVAKNTQGETRADAALHVYGESDGDLPEGYPRITAHPQLRAVERGRTAVLSCEAEGVPTPEITWLRDRVPVKVNQSRIRLVGKGYLQIKNSKESDAGRYECVAENEVGVAFSYFAMLYVKVRKFPPHFTNVPNNVSIGPGYDLNLTCSATGSPMPFVTWREGNHDLYEEDMIPVGKNILRLEDVRETKTYTCVASSDLGEVVTSVAVTVLAPGSPPRNVHVRTDGLSSISVFWDEPDITNGNIQGYRILYTLKPQTSTDTWSVQDIGSNVLSGTVHDLEQNQTYTIRVLAYSTTGEGPLSDPVQVTAGKPVIETRVETLRANVVSANEIDITWTVSGGGNSPIPYNLFYNDTYLHKNVRLEFVKRGKTYRLTGLTPDTVYHIQLSTNRELETHSVQAKTKPYIPGEPREVMIERVNSTALVVKWRPPLDTDQTGTIRGYEVYLYEADKHHKPIPNKQPRLYDTFDGNRQQAMISELDPFKQYIIRVGAYTLKGGGVRSRPKVIPVATVSPTIISGVDKIRWREGQKANLTCNVTGTPQPKVTWYKHTCKKGSDCKERISFGDVLRIRSVTRYHDGKYECFADNGVPPAVRKVTRVIVEFAPNVTVVNKRIGESANRQLDVVLKCIIHAHPQGTGLWKRNGVQIRNSEKFITEVNADLETRKVTLSLQINNIQASDYGSYTCASSNALGSDEDNVVLYDKDLAKAVIVPPYPQNTSVVQNGTVSLQCSVQSYVTPTIQWFKRVGDSDDVDNDNIVTFKGQRYVVKGNGIYDTGLNRTYHSELLIKHVAKEDAGMYLCIGTNSAGYDMRTTFLSVVSSCNRTFYSNTTSKGNFTSPNYPGQYPRDTECQYLFYGKENEKIYLSFTKFNVEGIVPRCSEDTQSDYVAFSDYPSREDRKYSRFCGDVNDGSNKTIHSDGSFFRVVFKSNERYDATGFFAYYEFKGPASTHKPLSCDRTFYSNTTSKGNFTSPNYPGQYPRNTECQYLFYGKENEKVYLSFTKFSVEGIAPRCGEDTQSDYVAFSDYPSREDRKYSRFCGDVNDGSNKTIQSDGSFFRVVFKSNERYDATGFFAYYEFKGPASTHKPLSCDRTFYSNTTSKGNFTSPNYPGQYPRNTECQYLFYGKENEKVYLSFTKFSVDGISPGCNDKTQSDFVEFSNYATQEDRKYSRFCGHLYEGRNKTAQSDGSFFRVVFKSNEIYNDEGFFAYYEFKGLEATPKPLPPGSPPQNVQAQAVNSSAITVSWTEPEISNGIVQGYNLFYTLHPENPLFFWDVRDVTGNRLSTTITGLLPDETYTLTLLAYSAVGQGPMSHPIQLKTPQETKPTRSQVISLTGTRFVETGKDIRLICNFTVRSINIEEEVDVDWFKDGQLITSHKFSNIVITKYVEERDTSLVMVSELIVDRGTAGDAGIYVCRSSNDQIASINVSILLTVPAAPKNVMTRRLSGSVLEVRWDEPESPVTGYKIYYSMFAVPDMNAWQSKEIGPNTVAKIKNLEEDNVYAIRVQARSVDGRYGTMSEVLIAERL